MEANQTRCKNFVFASEQTLAPTKHLSFLGRRENMQHFGNIGGDAPFGGDAPLSPCPIHKQVYLNDCVSLRQKE